MSNKKEKYNDLIWVRFSLPSINLEPIIKKNANWFQRLAQATRRRFFTLDKDWQIELNRITYKPELNGIITIRNEVEGKKVSFDGASVPLPWLVSFLSMGILRPLGVMLTASIVHDFAFKFGYLLVSSEEGGAPKKVFVERDDIDHLFRDILGTVNQVVGVSWIAWFFVRLGWLLRVKYNGQCYGGKWPIGVMLTFVSGLVFLNFYLFENFQFQQDNFDILMGCFVLFYLVFYVFTLFVLRKKKR